MTRLLQVAEAMHEAGVLSGAQLRLMRIHQSYWVLREAKVRPSIAIAQVAVAFGVAEDTVQVYARERSRFDEILKILSAE